MIRQALQRRETCFLEFIVAEHFLRENNTQNLVEDIERLRRKLRLNGVIIFGGSWGSTLGLAYAEKYPQHVSAMILRDLKEMIEYPIHALY